MRLSYKVVLNFYEITYRAHFHRQLINISYHFTYRCFHPRPQLHSHLYVNNSKISVFSSDHRPEFQMFPKLLAQHLPLDVAKACLVNMPKASHYFCPKPQPLPRLLVQVNGITILPVLLERNLGVILLVVLSISVYIQSITPTCLLYSLNISFIQPIISVPMATVPNQASIIFLLYHFYILQSGLQHPIFVSPFLFL